MINSILILICSLVINIKTTRDLQLSKYELKEFKKYVKFYLGYFLIFLAIMILLSIKTSHKIESLIFYLSLTSICFFAIYRLLSLKVKPKFTKRYLRLLYFVIILNIITSLAVINLPNLKDVFLFLPLNIVEVFIINAILYFPETKNNNKKILENTQVLRKGDITVIGITGSFGKTTVKEILYELLSIQYDVVKTDGNRNTPIGISLTCGKVTDKTKYFIAEMGARRKGDIKELVKLTQPKIGIITGVNNQHIETFKTQENIYNEKKELALGVNNGILVVNGDNEYSAKMYNESVCKNKYKIGLDEKYVDLYAKDIIISNKNTIFTLVTQDKELKIKTSFLGIHNVTNILLAAKTAMLLGIEAEEIADKLESLAPTENRMKIIESNGIIIIDDSYNANIDGVMSGLKVLKGANGRRIILAQGIVENTKETNLKVGREIAKSCDIAILIGKNRKYLEKGMNEEGFGGKIFQYTTLKKAQDSLKILLKNGDTVYIQNDLVD